MRDEKLRPNAGDADMQSAAALCAASDGLGSAFPREELGEGFVVSSLVKIQMFPWDSPVPYPKITGLLRVPRQEQVPASVPHSGEGFSTSGKPAQRQPLLPNISRCIPTGPHRRPPPHGQPGAASCTVCRRALGAGAEPGGRCGSGGPQRAVGPSVSAGRRWRPPPCPRRASRADGPGAAWPPQPRCGQGWQHGGVSS